MCNDCRKWIHGIPGTKPCPCACHDIPDRDVCYRCANNMHGWSAHECPCYCHTQTRPEFHPRTKHPAAARTRVDPPAVIINAEPSAAVRAYILSRDHYRCRYCGRRLNQQSNNTDPLDATIDHIHPRSRGGTNKRRNLVACCLECNRRKGDLWPDEAGMVLLPAPDSDQVGLDGSVVTGLESTL